MTTNLTCYLNHRRFSNRTVKVKYDRTPDLPYNTSNKRVYINQLTIFDIDTLIGYRFLFTRGPLPGAPAIRAEDIKNGAGRGGAEDGDGVQAKRLRQDAEDGWTFAECRVTPSL